MPPSNWNHLIVVDRNPTLEGSSFRSFCTCGSSNVMTPGEILFIVLDFEVPAMDRDGDGMGAVVSFQFFQNIADMSLDSVLAYFKAICNDLIRAALGDELQNLDLSPRQGFGGAGRGEPALFGSPGRQRQQ